MRRLVFSLFLVFSFVGGVYGRVTCKDFDTQAEAQRWYYTGGVGGCIFKNS